MRHSPLFSAVLDANVIYPAPVRDLLLNLADLEIFTPKWSETIHEEWIRNLLVKRKDLSKKKLLRTIEIMNSAFPYAEISGFEELIDELNLPDLDDRHVLAAAIHGKVDAIITFNQKDFPPKYLNQFKIKVFNPDGFLTHLHKSNSNIIKTAFHKQLVSLKNPPKTREELIEILVNCNLKSVRYLLQ